MEPVQVEIDVLKQQMADLERQYQEREAGRPLTFGLSSGTEIITPSTSKNANVEATRKSPINKVEIPTFDRDVLTIEVAVAPKEWSEEAQAGKMKAYPLPNQEAITIATALVEN